jgi:predicted GNAT superfamily acetyltransferase
MIPTTAILRSIDSNAQPAILALNNAHAIELSWLDADRLAALLSQACYARSVGEADAFLLAFDATANYDGFNYLWFRQRYPRFVYIDRVVVASHARRHGYARLLYADLFDCAARAGHDIVACEVNSEPPNPASDAFHTALGFREVGCAALPTGDKTVRYLIAPVDPVRRAIHRPPG